LSLRSKPLTSHERGENFLLLLQATAFLKAQLYRSIIETLEPGQFTNPG
jgi:hypothetical protein